MSIQLALPVAQVYTANSITIIDTLITWKGEGQAYGFSWYTEEFHILLMLHLRARDIPLSKCIKSG